jgi:hypothetical protein
MVPASRKWSAPARKKGRPRRKDAERKRHSWYRDPTTSFVPCARRVGSTPRARARRPADRAVRTYVGTCSKRCGAYRPYQTLTVSTPASAATRRCDSYPTGSSTVRPAARRCSRSTRLRPIRIFTSTAQHTGRAGWTAASGNPAASSITQIWLGGRTHPTGSPTTGVIAPVGNRVGPRVSRTGRTQQRDRHERSALRS